MSTQKPYKHIFILGSDAEDDFELIRNKFQAVYGKDSTEYVIIGDGRTPVADIGVPEEESIGCEAIREAFSRCDSNTRIDVLMHGTTETEQDTRRRIGINDEHKAEKRHILNTGEDRGTNSPSFLGLLSLQSVVFRPGQLNVWACHAGAVSRDNHTGAPVVAHSSEDYMIQKGLTNEMIMQTIALHKAGIDLRLQTVECAIFSGEDLAFIDEENQTSRLIAPSQADLHAMNANGIDGWKKHLNERISFVGRILEIPEENLASYHKRVAQNEKNIVGLFIDRTINIFGVRCAEDIKRKNLPKFEENLSSLGECLKAQAIQGETIAEDTTPLALAQSNRKNHLVINHMLITALESDNSKGLQALLDAGLKPHSEYQVEYVKKAMDNENPDVAQTMAIALMQNSPITGAFGQINLMEQWILDCRHAPKAVDTMTVSQIDSTNWVAFLKERATETQKIFKFDDHPKEILHHRIDISTERIKRFLKNTVQYQGQKCIDDLTNGRPARENIERFAAYSKALANASGIALDGTESLTSLAEKNRSGDVIGKMLLAAIHSGDTDSASYLIGHGATPLSCKFDDNSKTMPRPMGMLHKAINHADQEKAATMTMALLSSIQDSDFVKNPKNRTRITGFAEGAGNAPLTEQIGSFWESVDAKEASTGLSHTSSTQAIPDPTLSLT